MHPGAAIALGEYLHTQGAPFCWARHNCAHYVAGWVKRATGRDVLAALAPAETPAQWVRLVTAAGGWRALVTQCLRCEPVPPAFAQVGDVVLFPGPMTGGTLALCAGITAVALGDEGACVHLPMRQAVAAWPLRHVCTEAAA